MKVLGIIPARYASTRFPGKPLAKIAGRPMIQHVYEQSKKAKSLDFLLVATDDARILSAVNDFGGTCMMTSDNHPTGTDRLAEVALKYADFDIIVNIQGDEPLIDPDTINQVTNKLITADNADVVMASAMTEISEIDAEDPNIVKVVTDLSGLALYFSRSKVPYPRDNNSGRFFKHIGLYAYKRDFLLAYAKMPSTCLENSEKLEQLRVLENGYKIAMAEIEDDISIGVDTVEDLARAEELLGRL